ncbi:unnamed protein product [Schistocephalus solidus]|uniref:Reverse transcriptase domain-containing protein n=1 Tax=Schistocephalus solidus TaxID=70667 RepID=A0A183SI24_SCHSO|nr:unnamed protein product [Schistocephalus solidus]
MQYIIKNVTMKFLEENRLLSELLHGFRQNRSCLSNLVPSTEQWTRALDEDGRLQLGCIDTSKSTPTQVLSGVSQGSVLGPLPFLVYINDCVNDLGCSAIMQLRGDLIQTYQIVRGRECALEFSDFFELAGMEHVRGHPFKLQRKLVHTLRASPHVAHPTIVGLTRKLELLMPVGIIQILEQRPIGAFALFLQIPTRKPSCQRIEATAFSGSSGSNRTFHVYETLTQRRFLEDCGAQISVVPPISYARRCPGDGLHLQPVNTSPIPMFVHLSLTRNIGPRRSFSWIFVIADVPHAILGSNFLAEFELLVDCRRSRLLDRTTGLSA